MFFNGQNMNYETSVVRWKGDTDLYNIGLTLDMYFDTSNQENAIGAVSKLGFSAKYLAIIRLQYKKSNGQYFTLFQHRNRILQNLTIFMDFALGFVIQRPYNSI